MRGEGGSVGMRGAIEFVWKVTDQLEFTVAVCAQQLQY